MENEALIIEFADLIINKGSKVVIVSNGSFQLELHIGAAAWMIGVENLDQSYIYGNNITLGSLDSQYLHKSELGGLIGALFY